MISRLVAAFRDHPASVDETYFEHMAFAARFSSLLFRAAFAALIHAVFPFLFEKTASTLVKRMYAMVDGRGDEPQQVPQGAHPAAS